MSSSSLQVYGGELELAPNGQDGELRTAIELGTRAARAYLASRRTPSCERTTRSALRRVAQLCGRSDWNDMPWLELHYEQVSALTSWMVQLFAPRTVNRYLSSLKGVLREAELLELIDARQLQKVERVEGIAVDDSDNATGRALEPGELRALFAAVSGCPIIQQRDAAMLGLLYGGGLRRVEVHRLSIGDVDKDELSVRVSGKAFRRRRVPLPRGSVQALAAWRDVLGHREDGYPVFVATHRWRLLTGRRMCVENIGRRLRLIRERAAVAGFTAHDLRRTFVGDLFDAGADVATIQKLAGHRNPATTTSYDRRPARARARAVELLHVPYVEQPPST